MEILITNALLNIVLLFAFYLTGSAILKITKSGNLKNLAHYFESLLTGLLLAVFIYALIRTSLKTTFLALIPILIWRLRTKNEVPQLLSNEQVPYKFSAMLLATSVMVVLVTVLLFNNYIGFNFHEATVPLLHHDYVFYPNVAAHINETGAENYLIQTNSKAVTMYHYTELWLTALLNQLTNESYALTFIFKTIPLIFTILWIGFAALAESIFKNKSLLFYVSFASICFFVAPMAVLITPFSSILKGDIYAFPVFQYYKLSVIQLFIVSIFINRGNFQKMIFILMLLTICYQTTLPPILSMFCLYILVQFIRTRKIEKSTWQIFITMMLSVIILASILIIFSQTNDHSEKISFFDLWIGDIMTYLNTAKNVVISSMLIVFITSIVYIILLAFIFKNIDKTFQKVIAGSLLLQFIGLLIWAAMLKMLDSVQIWNNLYLPIINTVIFVIVAIAINDKRAWLKWTTVLIIATNLYLNTPVAQKHQKASASELSIIEKVKATESPSFAFIRHPSEFKNVFYFNTMVVTPSIYLAFHVKSYKPVCLNFLSEMKHSYWDEKLFSYSAFAQYGANTSTPSEKLQSDYITQNKIKFVFISQNVKTPDFLISMTDTVIIDPVENIKFLVLK